MQRAGRVNSSVKHRGTCKLPYRFHGAQREFKVNHRRNPEEECANLFIYIKQTIFLLDDIGLLKVIANNVEYCITKHWLEWEPKKFNFNTFQTKILYPTGAKQKQKVVQ